MTWSDSFGFLLPTPLIGAPCITDWIVIQIYARSRRTYMLEHGFCGSRNG